MSPKEIQKRNVKAENLRVLQSEDGQFFVESEKGKVLYNVVLGDDANTCTCGDYARNVKRDPYFNCKHVLAVINAIPRKTVENARFCEKPVPKLDERFMTNIKGKDFVLFAGVLDLATQQGLLKLEVELLQYPSKENGNEAICHAVAEGKSGQVFSDVGDANPGNCHSMIAKHLIRMASTRAKGRALRDMCNIGITCIEEIADFDDVVGPGKPKKASPRKSVGKAAAKADPKKTAGETKAPATAAQEPKAGDKEEPEANTGSNDNSSQPKMSQAQERAIFNLSRRRGISVEELKKMALDAYSVALESLNSKDASDFIKNLQQAA